MSELKLLARIRALTDSTMGDPALRLGIGDDCAIYRPRAGTELVFTTDFTLEERHFTLATHGAADVGHKALARSLSDLAAMGAKPAFCLVSLALPEALTSSWLTGFYRGLTRLARPFHLAVAGGDLALASKVAVDVMCCGSVPRGRALTRAAGRPGDILYVSGELGESALGLRSERSKARERHLRPEPRVRLGLALRKLGVRGAMDLSDGLALDLHRFCLASQVHAALTTLPVACEATETDALHGGEDYELLFAAGPHLKVPARLAGVQLTRIGELLAGHPGRLSLRGRPLAPSGFDHFAAAKTASAAQKRLRAVDGA